MRQCTRRREVRSWCRSAVMWFGRSGVRTQVAADACRQRRGRSARSARRSPPLPPQPADQRALGALRRAASDTGRQSAVGQCDRVGVHCQPVDVGEVGTRREHDSGAPPSLRSTIGLPLHLDRAHLLERRRDPPRSAMESAPRARSRRWRSSAPATTGMTAVRGSPAKSARTGRPSPGAQRDDGIETAAQRALNATRWITGSPATR